MVTNSMRKLFNLIAKEDANASIELAKDSRTIALAAKHDSSSMKTVAYMTMAFLPATFFAAFFSIQAFEWKDNSLVMNKRFWVYWAATLPVTGLVFLVWYLITRKKEIRERLERQAGEAEILKRTGTMKEEGEGDDAGYEKKLGRGRGTGRRDAWMQKVLRRRVKSTKSLDKTDVESALKS